LWHDFEIKDKKYILLQLFCVQGFLRFTILTHSNPIVIYCLFCLVSTQQHEGELNMIEFELMFLCWV